MITPSLAEARAYANDYSVIPISMYLYADIKTPIAVLKLLKEKSDNCFLLESVERGESWGRYSFLGYNPPLKIECESSIIKINGVAQKKETDPTDALRKILSEYKSPKLAHLPPFTGGLVGYFSYDFIKYREKTLTLDAADHVGLCDLELMLFDKIIAFDHYTQKIIIIVNAKTADLDASYTAAVKELEDTAEVIRSTAAQKTYPSKLLSEFTPLYSEKRFCDMVESVKHHIFEGDIFQAVLSNRLEADFEGDLIATYRALRTVNPSPYMYYLSMDDIQIAGASPETLISLNDGELAAFPIAGTCPRGETAEEDRQLTNALLKDEKELAEHNMLIDLSRNDMGRISKFGSVKVMEYRKIMKFSHVSHITSKVTGVLNPELDALDAISAVLPAGTLSGAPKIRACQIINRLERVRRGIYGGAIGYIDFTGNADLCITIRTAYLKNKKIYVQAGAGIVADSVPQKEARECMSKAQAVINSIIMSREVSQHDSDNR